MSFIFVNSNAGFPVSKVHITQPKLSFKQKGFANNNQLFYNLPKAQISDAGSCTQSCKTSGDMKLGVPQIFPAFAFLDKKVVK